MASSVQIGSPGFKCPVESGLSGNSSGLCLYRRGLWHDLAADFPCGVTDFLYGGADFPYGGAANRAANREFSAAIRQSGPKNTKRTTPSRPAKTLRMAAVHYDAPFAGLRVLGQKLASVSSDWRRAACYYRQVTRASI